MLIVEVLSPSTAHYDQHEKRWVYQTIATVRQLLFVSPDAPKIESVTREPDGSWRSVFVTAPEGTIALPSLDLALPMTEIYADITFADAGRSAG